MHAIHLHEIHRQSSLILPVVHGWRPVEFRTQSLQYNDYMYNNNYRLRTCEEVNNTERRIYSTDILFLHLY
jgi:hypothetical protein